MRLEKALPLTRHGELLLVEDTPKGRGVFARSCIPSGTVLETCPALVLDPVENKLHVEKTSLYHYTYNWPLPVRDGERPQTTQAVILGLGSMFNHSSHSQNVGWERDLAREIVTYVALRDIEAGEELCISYGSRLTFVDTDARPPTPEGDGSHILSNIQLDDP
ncbi:hypothetical protein AAFC00_002598 [Neodothiora populina]|uniref:SET domain-containing protein n=1 Tax=Neodothiora populina TaxID=2781224 RepID=A0ABR3P7W8_9PEZI